jgi:7-cyano-7-deazaguanine synthase
VDYGQRHKGELLRARRVARALGAADHRIVRVGLSTFGGSALTDARIAVPKGRSDRRIASGIPVTYVPARNTVMLALALAHAETLGARDIFLGVNAIDYSGYPDCRPAFIRAFERLAAVATKAGVGGARIRIRAPLLRLSKAGIVRLGTRLGVPYGITLSCYDPIRGRACGSCDACALRRRGFAEAGVPDPTLYSARRK